MTAQPPSQGIPSIFRDVKNTQKTLGTRLMTSDFSSEEKHRNKLSFFHISIRTLENEAEKCSKFKNMLRTG